MVRKKKNNNKKKKKKKKKNKKKLEEEREEEEEEEKEEVEGKEGFCTGIVSFLLHLGFGTLYLLLFSLMAMAFLPSKEMSIAS